MRVLVVYSGGQDSTTCLFWAIREYGRENVFAIGFNYGQRHKHEVDIAKSICDSEGISYSILDLSVLSKITKNALTDTTIDVDNDYSGDYPNTFVEGRNHLFLSFAAVYAKEHGIKDIVTGVCEADFSGYPDCRDIFIKSLNVTLNLAMDYNFSIITPLMRKTKRDIWKFADDLGCIDIIKNKTLTCYNGIVGDGCGECPACKLRLNGYREYVNERR